MLLKPKFTHNETGRFRHKDPNKHVFSLKTYIPKLYFT